MKHQYFSAVRILRHAKEHVRSQLGTGNCADAIARNRTLRTLADAEFSLTKEHTVQEFERENSAIVKHTPAPWTLNENETAPCELIGNGSIHIADIYMTDFPAGKADSLLIAAAPDLLAALRTLVEYMLESHEEELQSSHAGDADLPGVAPEACSYCQAIAAARDAIEKTEVR